MFAPKIRLEPALLERARERAQKLGYPSLEAYLTHLIEKDLESISGEEEAALEQRLKGLGYL